MAIATVSPVTGRTLESVDGEPSDLGMREFMNAKTVWIGEDARA